MTACILHGSTPVPHDLLCGIGVAIYDFQTLIAGVLAIGAAYYAARPVWRQLKDTNLQTRIQHRETLMALLREAQDRLARVRKSVADPLMDLDRLTIDPAGHVEPLGAEDAFAIEQRLHGELDWYLLGLRGTEEDSIEVLKAALKIAMDDLLSTLNDVHWIEHNEQHDEDHDISDADWVVIRQRSEEAQTLAAVKGATVRSAMRTLEDAQAKWIGDLRARIAKLDLAIAAAT
ncbi:hypothetical protein [Sphingomonas sp. GM_Shp_2]|uniref:hypothetical protein n=1 Tax=Sphingomonas sp. GM_Shp_2 TaxID=2937380 RepID=UPI00226A9CBF|nr:hypothetical protein [Sphingomonas sp. GM_Shp_2]